MTPITTRIKTRTVGAWIVVLALLGACGGGGGGGLLPPEEPEEPSPGGLAGRVFLRDYHLGRISSQEPNDTTAQAYLLPPVAARTTLEVTGEFGLTAARFGSADPADVLRFATVETQDVSLVVEFTDLDPVGGQPNDLLVEVHSASGDVVAASAGGGTPQTVSFLADVDSPLDVAIRVRTGHGAYVARFVTSQPAVAGLPAKPIGPAPVAAAGPVAVAAPLGACAPDHVIVRLAPGADPATVAERSGFELGEPTGTGSWRFGYPPAPTGPAAASKAGDVSRVLKADRDVLWAEPDWVVQPLGRTDDPNLSRQWHLRAIGAPAAWDVSMGDPDVVIAVVDTGITGHPDLVGRITSGGIDFISDPAIAGDGDGIDLDPTDVGDLGDSSGFSTWHGTFVSALAAGARDDQQGGVGVAPDCRILPLRALGIGGGYVSDVSNAILYAAGIGMVGNLRLPAPVQVINLSLGVDVYSNELGDACTRAANVGCVLVAAAGNDAGSVQFPAALDEVIAVGAVDQSFVRTYYSSVGPELDLVAPGGNSRDDVNGDGWPDGVLSALYDETVHPKVFSARYRDGTSASTPLVAGAAALLRSIDPTLTPAGVRSLLIASALDRGVPGRDDAYGHGMLQVHEAVRRLRTQIGTPLLSPPSLYLLQGSVKLHGLETTRDVLVTNGGGGLLSLVSAQPITDDGGPWLNATFVPVESPTSSDTFAVRVQVDRMLLPPTRGRWSGTLRLSNLTVPIGTIRVVVYVQDRQHAGSNFTVLPENLASGSVPGKGLAAAATSYRWWVRDVGPGAFEVRAGEDLDSDGVTCETAEACGYHGGPSQAQAQTVVVTDDAPTTGVDIVLFPQGVP